MKVRRSSVVLFALGVLAITAFLLYEPGAVPSYPLGTLGAGLLFIIVSIITMRKMEPSG